MIKREKKKSKPPKHLIKSLLDVVVHAYTHKYSGGGARKITV
jgi:hypothetical protein